jgi:hypothetical protein
MEDYITVDSPNLGSYTPFVSKNKKTTDVEFRSDLSKGYLSAVALSPKQSTNSDSDSESDYRDISGSNMEEKPIYSIGTSPVNHFFIGSVTVLGLFLLYRLLHKTK